MLGGWGIGFLVAVAVRPVLGLAGTTAAGNLVGLGLMTWAGLRISGVPATQALALRPFPARLLFSLVLLALSGSVLAAEIGNWTEEILPIPESLRQTFLQVLRARDWAGFLRRALLLSLLAPITEELLFRGIFQNGLIRNYGPAKGILIASVCFGIFHLIPWQALGAALVGLLLGLVVYRTGSIFAGMALHAIWNLLPLLLLSALPDASLAGYDPATHTVTHIPLPPLAVAAAVFLLGFRSFWRQTEPDSFKE